MKVKIFCILIISFLLIGCGQQKANNVVAPKEEKKIVKVSEEKTETIKADFAEINADKWQGKTVYVEGIVGTIDNDSVLAVLPNFLMKQQDGEGAYVILSPTKFEDIKKGDKVKITGIVDKKITAIPSIISTNIEKIK